MATTMPWAAPAEPAAPTSHRMPVIGRRALAGLLIVAGIAVVIRAQVVRAAEASLNAALMGWFTDGQTYVWGDRGSFYWGMGSGHARGLQITSQCSIAYVAGPMLVIFGLLLLARRLPLQRVVLGVAVGVGLMFVINTARILLVAASLQLWDSEAAFWWAHVVLGSVIAVAGNIAALAIAIRIAFARRSPQADEAVAT